MRFSWLVLSAAVSAATWMSSSASGQFVPGDIYVSGDGAIYHVDPTSWKFSTFADRNDGLSEVLNLVFSPTGTLICTNWDTNQIFEFDAAGNGTVIHDSNDGLSGPDACAFDAAGDLIVLNGATTQVLSFPAGGGAANVLADASNGLVSVQDVAVAADGTLLVADFYGTCIWSIDGSGNVSLFDTLPDDPLSLSVRVNGDIYVKTGFGSLTPSIYRYAGGVASQRTLLATNFDAQSSIELSFDQSTLYVASAGELDTVDAVSGVTNNVIDSSKGLESNGWAVAVFGNSTRARWSNYGAGFPGTNGVPTFTSQGNPVLGTTVTVDAANSFGAPTVGWLFTGVQQANFQTGRGGVLLVDPLITLPITFTSGPESFSGAVPNDPLLLGAKLELQVVELDPGAAKGASFTQGLELVFGY